MKKQKIKSLKDLILFLPTHSFTKHGQKMEPVLLIIVGNKRTIRKLFANSGWFEADYIGPISLLKTIKATFLNSSYHQGLINPSFINNKNYQLAFERPTKTDTYRRRHHIRLWKIKQKLHHASIWVGTISYDRSIGLSPEGIPTHHINPGLINEDSFLARSLNVSEPKYIKISKAEEGTINNGDKYVWDGRALFVDLLAHGKKL